MTNGAAAPAVRTAVPGAPGVLRRTLAEWRRAAHAIGVVQTRLLMLALYAVLVLPMGLLFRLTRDPLHLRPRPTNWVPCAGEKPSLERARQQF
jgi:hypothetical protein